jgi:predicted PurR-regulated permease PerM
MDQAERKDTAQHALVYVGIAVAVVIVLVLLWYAIDVVLLAFIGVLAAILLRAPADWISKRFGLREAWSLALVGAMLLGVLVVGGVLFGRGILSQALALVDRIPEIIEGFREELGKSDFGERLVAFADMSGMFSSGGAQVLGRGLGLIGSTFGVVANVLIVVFFAVFMAAQPKMYVEGALYLVACKKRDRVRAVLYEIGHVLRRWLVGQTALAVCVAVLTGAGLVLLGAPFPFALALLAGLMEFVPYIGPFLAAIPAVMVGFANGPELALYIAALFIGVQLVESYVLAPLVQQRAVHLPPAAILFAQVLMGAIVGALGVAVATPLAAAITVAVGMLYVEDALGDKNAKPASNRRRSSP